MDADEMLARALQDEELAAARQHSQQQGPDAGKATLLGLIQSGLHMALSVEDPALIGLACAALRIDNLRREAQEAAELDRLLGEQQPGSIGVDDMLVQALLKFFKREFFRWVDQPSCDLCTGPTSAVGMAAATPAEAADGAGRVEVYRCSICQQCTTCYFCLHIAQLTRFPRYTNPRKLLETRKGRCGEWAHTFLLALRAAGLDARHVTDNADHVWCEYYSTSLGRWVHVDACEEAWDTPLLYESGWGKSLSYVFAASRHGVADVTRRYVVRPQSLHTRRTQVPEAWLSSSLTQLTAGRRTGLDVATRRLLGLRDAAEALQLMSLEEEGWSAAAAAANLPGRQSGAEAWRSARGETGTAPVTTGRPPTSYCHAPDNSLPALFHSAGRITGGECRASGENRAGQPSQQVLRLFDGSLSSKWLDFGGGGAAGTAWAEYRLLPGQAPCAVCHYDLISAEDCPERDPCDWVLECIPVEDATGKADPSCVGGSKSDTRSVDSAVTTASSSSNLGWIEIDRRQQQHFRRRHQLCSFHVPAARHILSRQWRLRVTRTANPPAANSVQIACWNLYSSNNHQTTSPAAATTEAAEQPATKATAGSHTDRAGSQRTNLYLVPPGSVQLADLLRSSSVNAPESRAISAEATTSCRPSPEAAAVATVKRILTNMHQNPGTTKFWQVSATAAKLQPVLQDPLLLSVLFEAGFRPVFALPAAGTGLVEEQLRLVADEGCTRNTNVVASLTQET